MPDFALRDRNALPVNVHSPFSSPHPTCNNVTVVNNWLLTVSFQMLNGTADRLCCLFLCVHSASSIVWYRNESLFGWGRWTVPGARVEFAREALGLSWPGHPDWLIVVSSDSWHVLVLFPSVFTPRDDSVLRETVEGLCAVVRREDRGKFVCKAGFFRVYFFAGKPPQNMELVIVNTVKALLSSPGGVLFLVLASRGGAI